MILGIKMMIFERLLFVFLLMVPSALAAQDEGKEVTVRFVAQALPREGLGSLVMVAGEEQSEPFVLPMNNLTDEVRVPARSFRISQEGKSLPLATVRLPEAGSSFIVLLLIGKEAGYTPVVLPAGDSSFKAGDVYLHNTSDSPVYGQVGSVRVVLEPSRGRVVTPAGAVNDAYYNVAFAVREGDKPRYLTTSRWPVAQQGRSYVFFFNDIGKKRVSFRSVEEPVVR